MMHRFPHAQVTLDFGSGPIAGTFLIDTGANTTFDIYKPFADAHAIRAGDDSVTTGAGVGGTTAMLKAMARSASIGAASVENIRVYHPQSTEGLLAVHDVAGLAGTLFLKRFRVTIDEPRRVMMLEPR